MGVQCSNSMILHHGSRVMVERPLHGMGNPCNDYGLGFYCTESRELACEWACPDTSDGYVNEYAFDLNGLRALDLDASEHGCLQWLAVLVANRRFDATTPLMVEAKEFMLARYLVDVDAFDVVTGYRADDSCFSFARAFLDNRLSLGQLERALRLGGLGRQVVMKSPRSFDALSFVGAEPVEGAHWHPRRHARDEQARRDFRNLADAAHLSADDVFVVDLLRKG